MEYRHYANVQVLAQDLYDVPTKAQRPSNKPRGLWLSVDDSWPEFCKSEGFQTSNGLGGYQVVDISEAKILTITTGQELLAFTRFYQGEDRYSIRWDLVAQDYDGISIPEYLWRYRLNSDTAWYYTWDVACACVWNATKVTIHYVGDE